MQALGDCTHAVQDPVAAAISQGKQNNTASASAGTVLPSDITCHVPCCWVRSITTGQVSDIISAELCQHYLPALQSL